MINFTTTYTTSTTNGYRHDTTQSVVIQRGAQNRRARRVRRGYKKEQRSCEKILGITFHNSSLQPNQRRVRCRGALTFGSAKSKNILVINIKKRQPGLLPIGVFYS